MNPTTKCISACATTLVCFGAFAFFRSIQLSQDNSYHNPFTDISTGLLTAFFVLWAFSLRWTWKFREMLTRSKAVFCWGICGMGACYTVVFLIAMFVIVFGF